MPYLDPTYLRYIYDNLIKGSVHPDNASELPDGLIGLYEEAFEENFPILQRQKLLKRFALFALLKKEVSVHFVSEILKESEADLLEFININSSWFNSPEPGKFQLYHERLKVYLLQKLSEKETQSIHEKLIARIEQAIEEQKADEFERYALEFLSEHLTVEAFGDESKGKKLLDFTKNETIWDRQIRISNKFDWSRKALHQAALWTSKYDQDENIDCYLDLVQLHNKEQNDAESIVRLVANNEIDLALERITAFGGLSKEEKERQFILFMLCLMELTLLESKTQPWRKEAIEKLLKHLEEEIPVDHSFVNWGEFFSSYLMMDVMLELNTINCSFHYIFQLTSSVDFHEILDNKSKIFETEKKLNTFLLIYQESNKQLNDENYSDLAFYYVQIGKFRNSIELIKHVNDRKLVDKYKYKVCDYFLQNNAPKYVKLLLTNLEFKDDEFYFKLCKFYINKYDIENFEFFLSKIDSIDEKLFLLIRSITTYREQNKFNRLISLKNKLCIYYEYEGNDDFIIFIYNFLNENIINENKEVIRKNIKLLFENFIKVIEDRYNSNLNESVNESIFHLLILLYKCDLNSLANTLFESYVKKINFDDFTNKDTIGFRILIKSYLFKSNSNKKEQIFSCIKLKLQKHFAEDIIGEFIIYLLSNNLFTEASELSKTIEKRNSIYKNMNSYIVKNKTLFFLKEFFIKSLIIKLQIESDQKEFVLWEYLNNYLGTSNKMLNLVSFHKIITIKKLDTDVFDKLFIKDLFLSQLKKQISFFCNDTLIDSRISNIKDDYFKIKKLAIDNYNVEIQCYVEIHKDQDFDIKTQIEILILDEFVKFQISKAQKIDLIIELIEESNFGNLLNLNSVFSEIIDNYEIGKAEIFLRKFLLANSESIFLVYKSHLKLRNYIFSEKYLKDLRDKCLVSNKYFYYLDALVHLKNFNEIRNIFNSTTFLQNKLQITYELLKIYDRDFLDELKRIIIEDILFFISLKSYNFDRKCLSIVESILVKLTFNISLNNNQFVIKFFEFTCNLIKYNLPERIFKNRSLTFIGRINSNFINDNLSFISRYLNDRNSLFKIIVKLTNEIEFHKINFHQSKVEQYQIEIIKLESLKNISFNSIIRNDYFYFNKDCYKILEVLIFKYTLNKIFFSNNYPNEKLQKFNRVLNLQWAIDLKKELDELPN